MSAIFDDPEMQEIYEGFLIETNELLDNISQDLMILENDPNDLDLLNRIFRSFHTIKGTSSFMGFDPIAKITHHAEDILNKLRKEELFVNQPIIDVLLEVYDWIVSLLEKIQSGDASPNVDFSDTIRKIEILKTGNIPDEYKVNDSEESNEHFEESIEEVSVDDGDSSILDKVLDNRDMFDKPGDFTDDELELLQQAFAEVNKSFTNKQDTVNSKVENTVIDSEDTSEGEQEYSGPTVWDSMDTDEILPISTDQDTIQVESLNETLEAEIEESEQEEINSNFVDNNLIELEEEIQSYDEEVIANEEEIINPSKLESKELPNVEPKNTETPVSIEKIESKISKPEIIKPQEQSKPKVEADSKSKPSSQSSTETIRVDVQRLETLMDLSGELVLGRNRLAQLTNHMEATLENKEQVKDLTETTTQIDFITSEIQSAVMRMRMVPIGKLYQKAPRIVRDLAKEFSKKINLVVKGEETEIDRGIIEELNDPLVHMIRNSCDHGVESPKERLALGKPETGTITLDADQEGNNIVLKISDDGKGMDPEKLKSKAVEKGVITQEQAAQMSAREAFQLIFAPGFSTAAVVSAVSGRGVGMDVVRTNIHKLKGIIDIESEIGVGTTFIIKLPLTLAIIQGLLVKVQNETYAIPLSSVVEVVSLEQDQVNTINTQEVIRVRSEVLPIIRLDKVLQTSTIKDTLDKRYVVNVGLGMQRVGFVVDELLGQQEIVIKSLGEYLGSVRGIAGSTIMGDGRVIMIVDVAQLLESIYNSDYNKKNE